MTARLIYGNEDRLLPWASARIGIPSFRRDAFSLGLEKEGELVAVVVFDCFSDTECNLHIASDGTRSWMSKSLLLATFAYPFTQLRLRRVTALVPASNTDAINFDKHIGFVEEGCHRKAAPDGEDMISLGMLREECRWIPEGDKT